MDIIILVSLSAMMLLLIVFGIALWGVNVRVMRAWYEWQRLNARLRIDTRPERTKGPKLTVSPLIPRSDKLDFNIDTMRFSDNNDYDENISR